MPRQRLPRHLFRFFALSFVKCSLIIIPHNCYGFYQNAFIFKTPFLCLLRRKFWRAVTVYLRQKKKKGERTHPSTFYCAFFCSSIRASCVNLAPSLKAYSKMAASARLTYSFQHSWYFSNISCCSSFNSFPKSSLCLAI